MGMSFPSYCPTCIVPHVIGVMPSFNLTDSPGVPVSATSKELFRGFSYVDPNLMDEERALSLQGPQSTVHMSTVSTCT